MTKRDKNQLHVAYEPLAFLTSIAEEWGHTVRLYQPIEVRLKAPAIPRLGRSANLPADDFSAFRRVTKLTRSLLMSYRNCLLIRTEYSFEEVQQNGRLPFSIACPAFVV